MGVPSYSASNALIYVTYAAFLVFGCAVAYRLRHQSKQDYLASNRTQKGVPLALNFIASALGSGILFTYPEIATIAGLQGVLVYSLSSALPLLAFGLLGPIIRKKCPEGFVLTEWTRERYGIAAALLLSFATLVTLFLYMVAELSALQQIVNALTGLSGTPAVIVECAVTTIYTTLGGFKVSFITDTIQGAMVAGLIVLSVITVGAETHIESRLIGESHLLKASLLGWQLIYILPVAILTNDFLLSGFWLRTFASKTDKDLMIGVSIATVVIFVILTLIGVMGLLAAWSGAWPFNPPDDVNKPGYLSFFLLLEQLPAWVVGIVLVMVVVLSTAAFDSLQSAMVSSGSNDLFRNKLHIMLIRLAVVIIIFPVVVVALESPDILQIYLISDLVSASLVPVLMVGLVDKFYWWRGCEVVVGGFGGVLTIFLFGLVYYNGDATLAGKLILLEGGLYAGDWSAFGAFVAAPVGGLLWGLASLVIRLSVQYLYAKRTGKRFTGFDKPVRSEQAGLMPQDATDETEVVEVHDAKPGKFF